MKFQDAEARPTENRRASSRSPSSEEGRPGGGPARTLLLDDHAAFLQALAFMLGREPDFEVVAAAGSLAEARRNLPEALDLAVVDLALPDGEGYELVAELRRSRPGAAVLVLSATLCRKNLLRAVEAGADGVVDKLAGLVEIVDEARNVVARRALPSQREISQMLHLHADGPRQAGQATLEETGLEPRELEAVLALAEGLGDEGVARRLGSTPEQARSLIDGILAKLGASSRLHALSLLGSRGII